MRGADEQTSSLFSDVSCEARVPLSHPLRRIRAVVDEALDVLSPDFNAMYEVEIAPISWTVCGLGSYVAACAVCMLAS